MDLQYSNHYEHVVMPKKKFPFDMMIFIYNKRYSSGGLCLNIVDNIQLQRTYIHVHD